MKRDTHIPFDLYIKMISCIEYVQNMTKGSTKMIMTLIHNESP
jgi:hypothetical protein